MPILDDIIAQKKREVALLPAITPASHDGPSFIDSLLSTHPSLIAEIKPKSPSEGQLLRREDVPTLVQVYDRHAQAISVLCDERFFGGGFDLLAEVRGLTEKPLLAKEFIVSVTQIDHALNAGADAVLLIAAILSEDELVSFTSHAVDLGLDVLIETHSVQDVEKTARAFTKFSESTRKHVLLGINNRDLQTLRTGVAVTEQLVPLIRTMMPDVRAIVTESGIHSRADVERLQPLIQGFLIGTSILKAEDPAAHLASLFHHADVSSGMNSASNAAVSRRFKSAANVQGKHGEFIRLGKPGVQVKFCGMTRLEDILAAEELGVDFVGFVFVPSSPRCVSLEDAERLRTAVTRAKTVGVFSGQTDEEIRLYAGRLQLDFIQLHGKPDLDRIKKFSKPVIQAFRGVPDVKTAEEFLKVCAYILIDKADGEEVADFDAIAALPSSIREKLFLAGGLTSENVRSAADRIRPYAVDCARGIESSPGIKDPERMRHFICRSKTCVGL